MKRKIFEFIHAHCIGYIPKSLRHVTKKSIKKVARLSEEAINFASKHMTSYVPR